DFPDDPDVELEGYLECFSVLAALAVAIPRLSLGSFVASTAYRNPGLMAKMAVTIDDISEGRLVLGLGSGDSEGEHLTFGFPHEQRVGRFEEALQIIRRLFNAESIDFDGAHHRIRAARLPARLGRRAQAGRAAPRRPTARDGRDPARTRRAGHHRGPGRADHGRLRRRARICPRHRGIAVQVKLHWASTSSTTCWSLSLIHCSVMAPSRTWNTTTRRQCRRSPPWSAVPSRSATTWSSPYTASR